MYICRECLDKLVEEGKDYTFVKSVPYESSCDKCGDYGIPITEVTNIREVK